MIFIYLLVGVSGLLLGRIINICSYKIPKEERICLKELYAQCLNRKLFISVNYNNKFLRSTVVQITTAFLFILIFSLFGFTLKTIQYLILIVYLLLVAIIDINTKEIYTFITLIEIILSSIFILIEYLKGSPINYYLLSALIGFIFIALIIFISNGMGWGDADVLMVVGLNLGLNMLINIMLYSFIIAGIVSFYFLFIKRANKKDVIPFTPFILLGTIFTLMGVTIF